jgi:hypothetical protein
MPDGMLLEERNAKINPGNPQMAGDGAEGIQDAPRWPARCICGGKGWARARAGNGMVHRERRLPWT